MNIIGLRFFSFVFFIKTISSWWHWPVLTVCRMCRGRLLPFKLLYYFPYIWTHTCFYLVSIFFEYSIKFICFKDLFCLKIFIIVKGCRIRYLEILWKDPFVSTDHFLLKKALQNWSRYNQYIFLYVQSKIFKWRHGGTLFWCVVNFFLMFFKIYYFY